MEKVRFTAIHEVVMDYLEIKRCEKLQSIGYWYYKFLQSNTRELVCYLPYFEKTISHSSYRYIRAFTYIFGLLKQQRVTEFAGTCLFDIFNATSNSKISDLTLDYSKQSGGVILWGEYTKTKIDCFLPVFKKSEIIEIGERALIVDTFKLFKHIRKHKLIDFPILIDLKKTTLSFNNLDENFGTFISEKQYIVDTRLDDDSAMNLEEELINEGFHNTIKIGYPYSKNPHNYLIDVGEKKFNLVFKNRFQHNDINNDDLYLLNDETNLTIKTSFRVIDTNHNKSLYDLMTSFKEQWSALELNKFTTPFPKYWLLFLNNSLTQKEWLNQFKIDFPAVAEKPIINTVETIIEELIELNWIEKGIIDSVKILFPELKSNRKKRLEFVFSSFKNYVTSLHSEVEFIDSADFDDMENVVVLDSFNIIDLVNKGLSSPKGEINVVVPDFLYFGYQPWIKLHLFNYQFAPLLNDLREKLDDSYISRKDEIERLKRETISEIKTDVKEYRAKYEKDIKEEVEDLIPNLEDLEYTNSEEIEHVFSGVEEEEKTILINQLLAGTIKIQSTEKVLVQKDSLVQVYASTLKKGDLFIRNEEILQLYKSDIFYEKLASIPQDVLKYQNQLFSQHNAYETLKRRGISYKHQNYFDNHYVLEIYNDENFRIPRRKKDWAIICEFLNISDSAQQLAFIAYYGRNKQNLLRQMYESIIERLLENNWIGIIEDPSIVKSVSEIVNRYSDIFTQVLEYSTIEEIAESIISTILQQLTFTEIQSIKVV
jgi:hypothetical protein